MDEFIINLADRANYFLIFCVLPVVLSGQGCTRSEDHIGRLQHIEGYWEMKLDDRTIVEYWKKVSNDGYSGGSFMVNGNDTIVTELLKIIMEKNKLYYIPTVFGQNDNKPVKFRLTSFTDTSFTFNNPDHDYPNTITYLIHDTDSLIALISGGDQRSRFGYYRVK